MTDTALRELICTLAKSMFDRGLTGGSTGNISARTADGGLLVSPTGTSFGRLDPARLSHFDESGQPLSAVLRQREIADTDGDGVLEVLDAFGDPLRFALLVKLTAEDVNQVVAVDPADFVQDDLADVIGYESILDQNLTLVAGQVRGPWPIEKYRLFINSVNLRTSDSGAVVTQ